MGLIEEAFPEQNPATLRKLWEDAGSRHFLLQRMGKTLYQNPEQIYLQDATNQLIALLSQAQFKHAPEECVHVAGLMARTIPINHRYSEVLPHMSVYMKELDDLRGRRCWKRNQVIRIRQHFGGFCLISLAFFHDALKARERAGYPSPAWYRAQGKHALYHAEMEEVTKNFERWEGYLSECFN